MKTFTLIAALITTMSTSFAQFGGTYPNCTMPAGYQFGQGAQLRPYANPMKGCSSGDNDCGIQTPGVGGNNPAHISFPPETPTGASLRKCFSIFVFDANMKCSSSKNFPCATYVTGYIVPASYNSNTPPSPFVYLGKSTTRLVTAYGSLNCVNVPFTTAPTPGQQYRVYLDFTNSMTCNQPNTKYIIDLFPEGGLVAVNLSHFNATRTGTDVQVKWGTEDIANISSWEVQRSYDKNNFTTLNTVTNAGSADNNFTFIDNKNNSATSSYYRIKTTTLSGEIAYSDLKIVKGISGKEDFNIYPNPVTGGTANIDITQTGIKPSRLEVLDNAGRIVRAQTIQRTDRFQLTGLVSGTYRVRLINAEGTSAVTKMITVIN